jgi:hypothetical protein
MRKYIFIVLVITLSSCGIFQNSNSKGDQAKYISLAKTGNDTTLYVMHNFINGKAKYIGKPLKELLKDLEIPIVSYRLDVPVQNEFKGPWTYGSIKLSPYTIKEASKRFDANEKPVSILISWPERLLDAPLDSVYDMTKGKWTEASINFFQNTIIGDIRTVNYNRPVPKQ